MSGSKNVTFDTLLFAHLYILHILKSFKKIYQCVFVSKHFSLVDVNSEKKKLSNINISHSPISSKILWQLMPLCVSSEHLIQPFLRKGKGEIN